MDRRVKGVPMKFENLTKEQMERARECKTPEELMKLAADEDLDLTDEQLEAIAGGRTAWEDINDCDNYGFDTPVAPR